MDVFASTIRRSPTAIDWAMNQTCLPVRDEEWFQNKYHPSCFLEQSPMERWRKLKASGNESPAAWIMVMNSLMRNAQSLTRGNLAGILPESDADDNISVLQQYFRNVFRKNQSGDHAKQLTLLHAIRCTTSALPEAPGLSWRISRLCGPRSAAFFWSPDEPGGATIPRC